MSYCEECGAERLQYFDGTLSGEALETFRRHLETCAHCREALEGERALTILLRQTQPLYVASPQMRQRVALHCEAHLREDRPTEQSQSLGNKESRWRRWLGDAGLFGAVWKPLVAIALVFFLGLAVLPNFLDRARATEYVEAATEMHLSYLQGDLPLQYESASPERVSAWFAKTSPLAVQLPNAQAVPQEKAAYWLKGARVVNYHGGPAALVAYETVTEKISLVVASSTNAVAAGGSVVHAEGLTFHYRRGPKFEVITWTNRGLTYALVSSLVGPAEHSCLVCHQNLPMTSQGNHKE